MNNAKMWLVVQPTVGIPLFLAGVAVASFAVHVAVVGKMGWYSENFLGNGPAAATASAELPAQTAHVAYTY